MPYLDYVFCEKCGNVNLDIDEGATIDSYRKEGRKSVFINPATLVWDYLIYSCPYCRTYYKYTFKDIERKTRMHFSQKAEKYKKYFDGLTSRDLTTGPEIEESDQMTKGTLKRLNRMYVDKG